MKIVKAVVVNGELVLVVDVETKKSEKEGARRR